MKLDTKKTMLVGLAFMTISSFWQLYNNEIPLMLQELIGRDKQFVINTIMTLDNLSALFLLPFFGMISDKTHTRIGKRMPYIISGTVLSVIFMLLLPFSYAYKKTALFFVAIVGVLLSMSVYRSPAVALMPDVTPKPLRSKGNAVINLMGAIGIIVVQVLTLVLKGERNYTKLFVIVAVFMLVSVAVMFVKIDENKLVSLMPPEEETEEERVNRINVGVKVHASVRKSLIFLFISVFLWFMAYSAIETNYSRYASDIWLLDDGTYVLPMLFGSLVALISFLPLGTVSQKFGRKHTIIASLIILFLAVLSISFITKYSILLYLLFGLVGITWAAINVNSYPMVVEMSKGADVGKYTGLYYTFSMAAQIATPLVTGLLFDLLPAGLRVLFPYAALFLLLGLITMIFVRHGDGANEHDIELMQEAAGQGKAVSADEHDNELTHKTAEQSENNEETTKES